VANGLLRCARNDGKHSFAFSPRIRASFAGNIPPSESEGAGNAGCTLHPRSRVQTGLEMRTRAYRSAEAIRHSLRNGVTVYFALSLVIGLFVTIIGKKISPI
jgi:hypothetical protein